ncbi:SDR family oxidoreductase [Actinomadura sp. B10D3]|uniref:SDR family oxidoreductase n=1 Tax=Actinomadura sp. B10D3 TaxID=3153557 RepID=UPI00325D23FB
MAASSKAALEGFSRGAARDLAHRGITVNIIQPGFIDTDGNPADGPASSMFLPTTAMGRYGRPEEIAAWPAAQSTASDHGRRPPTVQTLVIVCA